METGACRYGIPVPSPQETPRPVPEYARLTFAGPLICDMLPTSPSKISDCLRGMMLKYLGSMTSFLVTPLNITMVCSNGKRVVPRFIELAPRCQGFRSGFSQNLQSPVCHVTYQYICTYAMFYDIISKDAFFTLLTSPFPLFPLKYPSNLPQCLQVKTT